MKPLIIHRSLVAGTLVTVLAVAILQFGSTFSTQAAPKRAYKLPPGIRMERDISYIPDGDDAQRLDSYVPEKVAAQPLPLIVHIHGGGWRSGSKFLSPFLILHGTHDALVPYAQSEQLLAALKGKGVAAWLQTLPGAGHGGPAFGKPAVRKLTQDFFDKHLKGADIKIKLVPEVDVAVAPPKPRK
ncbi:MAG: prolyl oligopeptidase family serine peptidase [Verrucomicrobiia bacterium]|jgi:acetyl esterase/lipase